MTERINYFAVAQKGLQNLLNLEQYIDSLSTEGVLSRTLITLVKLRASQINGCAYCIDMHTKEARHAGETEQRLYLLSAWHESNLYSAQERAALTYTEAVTLISNSAVSNQLFQETREHFSETELVNLTLVITTINSWNRIAISFATEAGNYQVNDQR
ncbi:carboxymuconolactone decarboxylase family protein [Amphritea balenae]|uniref:Carboxymuconolactone decarboxylase family protein n=1 Tax=Amphritea balenae TaxID=452629 RepID=A0A3P1SKP4_9GAMM|nr:carboxymuconolactone decarboxylase family protein [Amphritea balenae]RRC97718.1 carboxymuconolactone decarboxylase family protein [Amphritea balenae]GGK82440.1 alkyl hydroperoxide reductase AhpD [Amphritea balenae]